ncbi:protoporphyrinogen oxidase 1 [Pyrus ussuriensis x Pyrus communis]|uniref:Protoporphyrinogen oxidase 1 n=1 Tax=Pyrus ussuriensis x Pyrus communis TaxID=2448454 RepID=A0A5N5HY18_9ROSA|nr:protoporphyrinogen oxidase 1 [Pyrus ussuriensis x Pyrus communis]
MFISVDCVVVGGGISGLCIAQVLATKHGDAVSNVIVMEAWDWVGGNIITRLRLEMKDPTKLHHGFGEDKQAGVYRIK